MAWKNIALKWAPVTVVAKQGEAIIDLALDEFSIELSPEVQGRLDVYAIKKGEAWEYYPVVSNSSFWESVEPGVESWNQVLLLQVELYRAPIEGADNQESITLNTVVYKHPDIQLDTTLLNPNDYSAEEKQ